jgi:hypothetical protein
MVPLSTLDIVLQAVGAELGLVLIQLAVFVVQLAGMWKVFTKANRAGWKAIIPIYNLYVMLKIGDNAWWWLVLMIVPIVNFYAIYKIHAGVARAFDRGIGFALGLTLLGPIFFPLLGFGNYRHSGPTRSKDAIA